MWWPRCAYMRASQDLDHVLQADLRAIQEVFVGIVAVDDALDSDFIKVALMEHSTAGASCAVALGALVSGRGSTPDRFSRRFRAISLPPSPEHRPEYHLFPARCNVYTVFANAPRRWLDGNVPSPALLPPPRENHTDYSSW